MNVRISVQKEAFDAGEELSLMRQTSNGIGGLCMFVGVVRDLNDDESVSGLFLEHYAGMTEKQIAEIVAQASSQWDIQAATVIHRIGQLHPSDEIVFVGTASAHRGDAFDACEFIIDYLKTRAAFWKKETTSHGDRWLETRDTDKETAAAWQNKKA